MDHETFPVLDLDGLDDKKFKHLNTHHDSRALIILQWTLRAIHELYAGRVGKRNVSVIGCSSLYHTIYFEQVITYYIYVHIYIYIYIYIGCVWGVRNNCFLYKVVKQMRKTKLES